MFLNPKNLAENFKALFLLTVCKFHEDPPIN